MSQIADVLITHVNMFTGERLDLSAKAIAVKGNRIAWVGSLADAAEWRGRSTQVIIGEGGTLLPGFIDAHFHLLFGSLRLDGIQLIGTESYEEMTQRIRAFLAANPDCPCYDGYDLHYEMGPGSTPLTRHHLDAIIADRPLFIIAYDYHTTWANTLALKMAGVFNGGECGPNSEIVLDEHGEATGELREFGASESVRALKPEPDEVLVRQLLRKGLCQAAELGVTSIHNMNGGLEETTLYAMLEDAGELTVRISMPFGLLSGIPFETLAKDAVHFRETFQSGMIRTGSVKMFMDGVIESHTGLLAEPYTDNPETSGAANYIPEDFNRLVVEADRLGFQVRTHAIGDLAVHRTLNAYELAQRTNGKRDSRHRVEHIELTLPGDVSRFKELGVIASMQPMHAPLAPGEVWMTRTGKQRWPHSFIWQTLRNTGATLVFGSDWPVVPQSPFLGMAAALNRKAYAEGLPDQRQSLEDTLRSYTRDAAYAEFQEHEKGQLKPGYLADMVLLSADIFKLPAQDLAQVKPLMTMTDGKIVYQA